MSSFRYDWWVNAVHMVQNYPARKQEYEALGDQMPPAKMMEYKAVKRAVEIMQTQRSGDDKLRFIREVYWTGSKDNIEAAACRCYVSWTTGKRWHKDFVRLVGECFGYLLPSDLTAGRVDRC